MGETVPEVLSLSAGRHSFSQYGKDLGRGITFLFFSYRDLKVSGNFTSASNLCVEVGRVRVDEARNRLQTKTKHHMIFLGNLYHHA